jgi:DNA polymerase elongation subunit (family B)
MKNKTLDRKKILFIDIETSPLLSYTWGLYEQNVIDLKKEWYIMSMAYSWLEDKKVNCLALPDFKTYKKDSESDRELVFAIKELLESAEVIVAHNGDQFDIKKINARLIYHGFTPYKPNKSIDTKKIAKKYFNFTSNKLNDLCKYLKIGKKEDTGGFKTWLGCMNGDIKSWNTMIKYNKQDVSLLKDLYNRLKPWIESHPNMNVLCETKDKCPKCLSSKVQKRGFGLNISTRYQRYQCQSCGGWFKGKI